MFKLACLLLISGVAAETFSPKSLISTHCSPGSTHYGGGPNYCGAKGSAHVDHDANGIVNGKGTTYRIASTSSTKHYTDVFDFKADIIGTAFNLVGSSAGYWCEDGKCNKHRAHNDNGFSAKFSLDGKTWHTPSGVKFTEHFANLGDGAGFAMNAIKFRYVKLEVKSGCWGCQNTDTVTKMMVDGVKICNTQTFKPVRLVSTHCSPGSTHYGGGPNYCGAKGSAAVDHDANGIVNGKGTTYRIAYTSSTKHYSDVFDFGKLINGKAFNLKGSSGGYWCEDGKCNKHRAHNDNGFSAKFSVDGKTWVAPSGVKFLDHFANLGDGAGFAMNDIKFRYVKLEVKSGCWGCQNTDTVTEMLVDGVSDCTREVPKKCYKPTRLVSTHCSPGSTHYGGGPNYCGAKGSAAVDHDANGIINGKGTTYTIAHTSSTKHYTDVFDFGKVVPVRSFDLVGSSKGYWCEDGKCNKHRAHNDNGFSAKFSVDGKTWFNPSSVSYTDHFSNLGDGAGFTFTPAGVRYVKLEVKSGCWGCSNTDTVTSMVMCGMDDTPSPTSFPTSTPTSHPTASPTANPTAYPTSAPTYTPTAKPTANPTAYPTSSPTGILAHGPCKFTSCTYKSGETFVKYSVFVPEKWHCEKSGSGCKCVCDDSLRCALRHHHTSGYKKTFEHC
jgi:hypothetical protein